MASIRETSLNKLADGAGENEALQLNGHSALRAENSEWISELIDLAVARRFGSVGHAAFCNKASDIYSHIARESQTVVCL